MRVVQYGGWRVVGGGAAVCGAMWPYLVVAGVALACYSNALFGEFVHDDIVAVTRNPDVLGTSSVLQLLGNDFWGTPLSDPRSHKSYRPLTTLSFRYYYICILFELHYITTQYDKINYSLSPNIFKSIWRKNPIWIFRYRSTKIFKGNYLFHNNLFVNKLKNCYIFFMQTCLLFWF